MHIFPKNISTLSNTISSMIWTRVHLHHDRLLSLSLYIYIYIYLSIYIYICIYNWRSWLLRIAVEINLSYHRDDLFCLFPIIYIYIYIITAETISNDTLIKWLLYFLTLIIIISNLILCFFFLDFLLENMFIVYLISFFL